MPELPTLQLVRERKLCDLVPWRGDHADANRRRVRPAQEIGAVGQGPGKKDQSIHTFDLPAYLAGLPCRYRSLQASRAAVLGAAQACQPSRG
jgi:hypothetical protein